ARGCPGLARQPSGADLAARRLFRYARRGRVACPDLQPIAPVPKLAEARPAPTPLAGRAADGRIPCPLRGEMVSSGDGVPPIPFCHGAVLLLVDGAGGGRVPRLVRAAAGEPAAYLRREDQLWHVRDPLLHPGADGLGV